MTKPITLESVVEEFRIKFPVVHHGCDDGFYACPKSEDYFGRHESLAIEERPCDCGAIEKLERMDTFIREKVSSLLTSLEERVEEKQSLVPYAEQGNGRNYPDVDAIRRRATVVGRNEGLRIASSLIQQLREGKE